MAARATGRLRCPGSSNNSSKCHISGAPARYDPRMVEPTTFAAYLDEVAGCHVGGPYLSRQVQEHLEHPASLKRAVPFGVQFRRADNDPGSDWQSVHDYAEASLKHSTLFHQVYRGWVPDIYFDGSELVRPSADDSFGMYKDLQLLGNATGNFMSGLTKLGLCSRHRVAPDERVRAAVLLDVTTAQEQCDAVLFKLHAWFGDREGRIAQDGTIDAYADAVGSLRAQLGYIYEAVAAFEPTVPLSRPGPRRA